LNLLDPLDIPDLLANLVERSMVSFDQETGRYQMSESMRSYAVVALEEGESNIAHRKHFDYFLSNAQTLRENQEKVGQFLLDLDNARASLEWGSRTSGLEEETLRLALGLSSIWSTAFHDEGRIWIRNSRERAVNAEPKLIARAEFQQGLLELRLGLFEDAALTVERGEAIASTLDSREIHANISSLRLWLLAVSGNLLAARDFALELVAKARKDGQGMWMALNGLGEISRDIEDWETAEKCFSEVLPKIKGVDRKNEASNLGLTLCRLGRTEESVQYLREAFTIADQLGHIPVLVSSMMGISYVLLIRGDTASAGRICGFGLKLSEKSPIRFEHSDQQDVDWIVSQGREIGGGTFASCEVEGASMTIEEVRKLVEEVTKS